jgi:hypothetical protein
MRPVANARCCNQIYVDQTVGNVAGNVVGNAIPLGTPTDGSLTTNVAYPGWTTATFVTDGVDDLNQVALNIAGNTYVGNVYIYGQCDIWTKPTKCGIYRPLHWQSKQLPLGLW